MMVGRIRRGMAACRAAAQQRGPGASAILRQSIIFSDPEAWTVRLSLVPKVWRSRTRTRNIIAVSRNPNNHCRMQS